MCIRWVRPTLVCAFLACCGESLRLGGKQREQRVQPAASLGPVNAQSDTLVTLGLGDYGRPPLATSNHSVKLHSLSENEVAKWSKTQVVHHSSLQYAKFTVKAGIILCGALILFFLYASLHTHIEECTGIGVQHVSCVVFMVLSVSTDLSTKSAAKKHGGHYAFDPAIAVVIVEVCKLVVSMFLFVIAQTGSPKTRTKSSPWENMPNWKDVFVLAVPGVVYTVNNILVFEAIEKVPIATFAVIRETRLVWNGLIWMAVFRVNIGGMRWLAIAGVLIGCTANQVPAALHSEFTWGVLYSVLLAFMNAAGGVVCEAAMKMKAEMDINLQNAVIYMACSGLALVYLATFRSNVFSSTSHFFHGFAPECIQIIVLQVINGLTVSRILKHVESVTKSMIAALCSPVICFLGTFTLHSHIHWNDAVASIVVVASCYFFLRQGPLSTTEKWPPQRTLPMSWVALKRSTVWETSADRG